MSNPFFQFKQFTIRHDKCAMKVGTDGVLLGAWAGTESCSRILDVGTGTGLIALMLAQRSKAVVDAIDIDADACLQAQENAESSLFAGRINVFHSDLADFAQASTHLYGLIVSNPPLLRRFIEMPEPTTEHGPPHRYADIRRFVAVQSQTACSTRTYCPYPALRPERSSYGLYSNTKSISFEGSLRHPRTRCTTETTVGRTDIRATRLSRLLRSADHRDCKTSVY